MTTDTNKRTGVHSSLRSLHLLLVAVLVAKTTTNIFWVHSLIVSSHQHRNHRFSSPSIYRATCILDPTFSAAPTTIQQRKRQKQRQHWWSSSNSCTSLFSSTTTAPSPSPDNIPSTFNDAKDENKNGTKYENENDDAHRVVVPRKFKRFKQALPFKKDSLDELILKTCVPTVMNLMVVPLVNAVDTFWVGRLGSAVMLAGQSAANQACFTLFFLVAFLPNMIAPLVAEAISMDDQEKARERICESLFVSNVLGTIGTLSLTIFPRQILTTLLLPYDSPVLKYAVPYLRWRSLGMVPSLMSATGSAAYRGLLNTVTPLKVSLMTNGVNLILDPLLIFGTKGLISGGATKEGLGFVGAAVATAASETLGGITYIRLLLRRKLARWSMILKPPPLKSLLPLLSGGAAMLCRQLALNIGFLAATRRAQQLDPSGVTGAAYGITMQIYSVGIISLVGMQYAAAALVPSFRGAAANKSESDNINDESNKAAAIAADDKARDCADRLFGWTTLVGLILGIGQMLLLPVLVPLFSTLPNVQEAVKIPTLIAAFIHIVNGPVMAGEGIMMGVGAYKDLAIITMGYIATMVGCLLFTPLGQRLDGIMWAILLSSIVQQVGVVGHYLKVGPLAIKKTLKKSNG